MDLGITDRRHVGACWPFRGLAATANGGREMYKGNGSVWRERFGAVGVQEVSSLAHALRMLQCLGHTTLVNSSAGHGNDGLGRVIQRSGLHRNGSASSSLLERTRHCIERHAGDEDFSVERLAKALHMSRASLHRKLVAIVGMAPGDFIRHIRLEMARRMLCECEDSVSTVAYAVGFHTLSGFSRAFTAHFGICPSRCRRSAA